MTQKRRGDCLVKRLIMLGFMDLGRPRVCQHLKLVLLRNIVCTRVAIFSQPIYVKVETQYNSPWNYNNELFHQQSLLGVLYIIAVMFLNPRAVFTETIKSWPLCYFRYSHFHIYHVMPAAAVMLSAEPYIYIHISLFKPALWLPRPCWQRKLQQGPMIPLSNITRYCTKTANRADKLRVSSYKNISLHLTFMGCLLWISSLENISLVI